MAVTNTFESADNPGIEVNVSEFGFENDLTATITAEGVEFPNFITIYDVDFTSDSVRFTWQEDAFVSGVTPEGNHDRNYFTFDFPEGVSIASVAFDADASELVEPSALPSVELLRAKAILKNAA